MNKNVLIQKIKEAAKIDQKKRTDIRYKRAMAFLIRKGFLKANTNFEIYYQANIDIRDLIWAGKNVEPRILEVLPAAAARLPKAIKFYELKKDELQLKNTIEDLNKNIESGQDFLNIPYKKLKVWMNLHLADQRTKAANEKKIMKTFRLTPDTIKKMADLKNKNGIKTDAELIENLVSKGALDPHL